MSLHPTEQIQRLIVQIGWLEQRQFMQLLALPQFELTVPQFHTLQQLVHVREMCNMSDLARATHQSAASLTGVVDRLIDKRLVERVRQDGDRRQVLVAATERGRALLHAINEARSTHMQAMLREAEALDAAELLRMLDQLLNSMRRSSTVAQQ